MSVNAAEVAAPRAHPGLDTDSIIPFMTVAAMTAVSYLYVLYLHFWNPVEYAFFVAEDSWAEWGTAAAFVLCSLVLVRGFVLSPDLRRPVPVLVALGAFFVAGEEASWGQRIFGFETPEALSQANWQGEANLHNLLTFQPHALVGSLILLWIVIGYPLSRQAPVLFSWLDRLGVPLLPVRVWPLFLLTAIYLIYPPFASVNGDEVAELYLGLALLILAIDIVEFRPTAAFDLRSYFRTLAVVAVLFFATTAALVAATFERANHTSDLHHYAAYRFFTDGRFAQSAEILEFLLRDPAASADEIRYDYGLVLTMMGRKDEARAALQALLDDRPLDLDALGADVGHARFQARALALLDRDEDATAILEALLAHERARLAEATAPGDLSYLNWSIAKTLFAMNRREEAVPHIDRARETAPDNPTSNEIRRWAIWQTRRADFIESRRQ